MLKTTASTIESHMRGIPLDKSVPQPMLSILNRITKILKHATEISRCNNNDSCIGFAMNLD
jgi:hypothetical protein